MARIVYSPTTVGGLMLSEAVDHIRKGRDLLVRAKALADAVTGAGSDVAKLEGDTAFGVPAVAGNGSLCYYGLSDFKTACDTATDALIGQLDMGG